jgi:Putative adhesin
MKKTQLTPHMPAIVCDAAGVSAHAARTFMLAASCIVAFLLFVLAPHAAAFAQHKFSKTYPARRNIRLQLNNRSGEIEVVGWDRNEIKIYADMEAPAARFTPILTGDGLVIDVMNDTRGREDVGDVNFRIHVPSSSTVDLETKRGNITVHNIQGETVRAVVSTEGDINLTGIRANRVMASIINGNILFDADLMSGGRYELKSTQGDINLRINAGSGFTLTATAPRTRNINLGDFAKRGSWDFQSNNRRVVGTVGDGGAILNTTNLRGSIMFVSR